MIPELEPLPRAALAHLPTPLEPLDRLSHTLAGPRIWMKRDDCTGLASGGNKTRKLEFLLGAAGVEGADVVITFGAVQSNHARQTAAACARLGLPCHLILARKVPWQDPNYERLGNLLLDRMFGAEVHLVEGDGVRDAFRSLMTRLQSEGLRPYVIPTGGSSGTGALGYALCADEIVTQSQAIGIELTDIVHATSSAGTQAGLLAGLELLGRRATTRVLGINVSEPGSEEQALKTTIAELTADALATAGSAAAGPTADEVQVDSRYVGEGYGLPTETTLEAVSLLARLEGVLLDPVYSGKAMGGLISSIRSGEFADRDNVVFVHTGGSASLPVYGEVLAPD